MHQGSCLCGSIRYVIDDDLKFIVNCHRRLCRKAHGAAFATLLFMPVAGFTVTQGQELFASYEIKAVDAVRCFCSRCGTRLYNYAPSRGMISLVVASLDTDVALRPIAHFNVESKSSWYSIADGLPQFSSVPGPAEFAQLRSG
jgi:hypothetical protein